MGQMNRTFVIIKIVNKSSKDGVIFTLDLFGSRNCFRLDFFYVRFIFQWNYSVSIEVFEYKCFITIVSFFSLEFVFNGKIVIVNKTHPWFLM